MKRKRSWKTTLIARVYCTACEQWYNALVNRGWYVRHYITHPDTPARTCGLCLAAMRQAVITGGKWRDWRNWERAAADVPAREGPLSS